MCRESGKHGFEWEGDRATCHSTLTECLGELVTAFEDDPQGVAEAVAAIALGFGAEAWARILQAADRVVVAKLLGLMAIVCPGWVSEGVAMVIGLGNHRPLGGG